MRPVPRDTTPDAASDTAPDALDTEIRRALESEALASEPPTGLAERTMARALGTRDVSDRRARSPVVLWAGAAAAAVVAFLVVGTVTTGTQQSAGRQTVGQRPGTQVAPDSDAEGGPSVGRPPAGEEPASSPSGSPDFGSPGAEPGPSPLTDPRIARTADLEVRVEKGRFDERWRQAEAVAGKFGGFVTASSAQELEDRLARGSITLQVPADKLDGALGDLRGLGRAVRFSSTATDVSGQIVDYDARLRAAQANEAALLDLTRQARSLEDNLAIRPRLEQARREIETLQARRASLQGRVEMATVTASLFEPDAAPSQPAPEGRIGQAWTRAGDAAAAVVAGMILAAGYLGPPAVLALGLWALSRSLLRRRYL